MPIAEAIVSLDGARNSHQARDALWEAVHVIVRYLGLLALACRSRIGTGTSTDSAAITDGLRALRRRDLEDHEWFALTCALVRPFEKQKDAYHHPRAGRAGARRLPGRRRLERLIAERDRGHHRDQRRRRARSRRPLLAHGRRRLASCGLPVRLPAGRSTQPRAGRALRGGLGVARAA